MTTKKKNAPAAKPTKKAVPETRTLQCKLTEEEFREKSRELANLELTKDQEVARKKEVVSEYTARINKIDADVQLLSQAVSSGCESRQVSCEWRFFQPGDKQKQLVRLDTDEVVTTAKLEEWEMQTDLNLPDETPDEEK